MHRDLHFAIERAATNVALRTLSTALVIEEMYRAANVIYVDFTDYAELWEWSVTDLDAFWGSIWDHFDHGTQRAILQLYRASPEDALARAGLDLGRIDCPALVVWGDRDSYIPATFADAYAGALGGDASGFLAGGSHALLTEQFHCLGLVAVCLDESVLAIDHARTRFFTQ